MARVSCASREIDPIDIAPVQNRLVIFSIGSTSSRGTGSRFLNLNNPRRVQSRVFCSSLTFEYFLNNE